MGKGEETETWREAGGDWRWWGYNQDSGHWGGAEAEAEVMQSGYGHRRKGRRSRRRARIQSKRATLREGGEAGVRMETLEKGKGARLGEELWGREKEQALRGVTEEESSGDVRLRKWARPPARLESPRARLGEGCRRSGLPRRGVERGQMGWGAPTGEVPGRGRTRAQWGTAGTVTCECPGR